MSLRGIWAVFRKEFRENLRDRRTLLSALAFGTSADLKIRTGKLSLEDAFVELAGGSEGLLHSERNGMAMSA